MTIGEKIYFIREQKGMSQETLAHLLGLKDKSSVCKIEKAGNNISLNSVNKYAKALGVKPTDLMDEDVETEKFISEATDAQRDMLQIYFRNKEAELVANAYIIAPEYVQKAVCDLLGIDKDFFKHREGN